MNRIIFFIGLVEGAAGLFSTKTTWIIYGCLTILIAVGNEIVWGRDR